ncbi:MAG: YlmH/Sll1252 family protein [Syntrophomonas sp.]
MKDYMVKMASNNDEKLLMARLNELVQKALQGTAGQSEFLDLHQQKLAAAVASGESVVWKLYGGYDEAERKRLLVYPEWQAEGDARIAYLRISLNGSQEETLSHRDYLGAILSLGIKREKVGDIIVHSSGAFIIVDDALADYICQQLTRVKHKHIGVEQICFDEFQYEPPELTSLEVNLASLRLDGAVAAVYNLSRSAVESLIEGGQIKLNHKEINRSATLLKPGDLITVRGQGRFRLEDVGGLTRKGRCRVRLFRW